MAIVQPGVRQQTGEGQSLSQCGTNLYLFTKATIFQVPEKSRGEEKKKRREKEEGVRRPVAWGLTGRDEGERRSATTRCVRHRVPLAVRGQEWEGGAPVGRRSLPSRGADGVWNQG